jgi:alkylation response protein AidB-like acyl-CoA dehydrogenase
MSHDESTEMFRDSARNFLSAVDQRHRVRALEASGGGFDRSTWRQLAELGWLSILVPESDGGLGLGIAEVCAIATEVGRWLLPEPFIDAGVHPVALLAPLPPGGLRDEVLAGILSGETVAGVAWQERAGEAGAGNGLTSVAARGDAVRLNGQKRFVRPGSGADGWIVSASLGDELALVWIEAKSAGLRVDDEFGVDGCVTATLSFDDAPARPLAQGDAARAALQAANELARIAQGAELAGIGRRSLELTREYMTTRVQFGKPIGSFQALQHRLVDGLIQVELAEACVRDALATVNNTNLASVASRVKARCAHAATEMTRMAIQLHGAIGTTNEYDIGLYFKRAMTLASRWGNAAAHRRRYAQLALRALPREQDVATRRVCRLPDGH